MAWLCQSSLDCRMVNSRAAGLGYKRTARLNSGAACRVCGVSGAECSPGGGSLCRELHSGAVVVFIMSSEYFLYVIACSCVAYSCFVMYIL